MEDNKTLQNWNALIARKQAGEDVDGEIAVFLAGAQLMNQVVFQAHVAADAEWRLHIMQVHERQTELMRRQVEALEAIAKIVKEYYEL